MAITVCAVPLSAVARPAAGADDEYLKDRVQAALESDPYFYGAHVEVKIENGNVVLTGFVFSGWDY